MSIYYVNFHMGLCPSGVNMNKLVTIFISTFSIYKLVRIYFIWILV